jgi:hypothetical protein
VAKVLPIVKNAVTSLWLNLGTGLYVCSDRLHVSSVCGALQTNHGDGTDKYGVQVRRCAQHRLKSVKWTFAFCNVKFGWLYLGSVVQ